MSRLLLAALLLWGSALQAQSAPEASGEEAALQVWRQQFAQEVERRLELPVQAQQAYMALLQQALSAAGVTDSSPQAYVLVDRSAQVQAAFVLVRTSDAALHWLGASPVSTGKPGSYNHFVTPLGVFAHSLDNPDFRAQGTFNENHIRGYGLRGMRVFDFGWQDALRGWGKGGISPMRLQMHATDPNRLEGRLGTVQSEGCVRIPASLNRFLDLHGVLDRDYEAALAAGDKLWVVRPGRPLLPWLGRYLVVIDSQAPQRPEWSTQQSALRALTAAAHPRHRPASAAPRLPC